MLELSLKFLLINFKYIGLGRRIFIPEGVFVEAEAAESNIKNNIRYF